MSAAADACKSCDPLCAPIEKALFCGLVELEEGGRPMLLIIGAFLGGVQFSDLVYEQGAEEAGNYIELVLDLLTGCFFSLGSWSVYRSNKQFSVPVLRLGLGLIVCRVLAGMMQIGFMPTYCAGAVADCAATPASQCPGAPAVGPTAGSGAAYFCEWDGVSQCTAKANGEDLCVESGSMWNAMHVLIPQLVAQTFYCWLMNSFVKKKEGLLQAAEDGSVPAPTPP